VSGGVRFALLACLLGVLGTAGWRIVQVMRADAALNRNDPGNALRWRAGNPQALLKQAETKLLAQDLDAAEELARQQLQATPADGRGYRVLAQVAAARGQPDRALALFVIAVRRAPRDLVARGWLAQHALEQGRPAEALRQIDAVLTLSPLAGRRIYPVLVQLAGDPGFADVLATTLVERPPWRGGMLAALRAPKGGDPAAADRVLAALQRKGGLTQAEFDAWIEALMQQGRWGEAYARWAGPQVIGGRRLPLLFNGDFEAPPLGTGFDWRPNRVPGVLVEIEPASEGGILHLRFLGRRVAKPPLRHALLLGPGDYTLAWRERSDALRATTGIGWTLTCANARTVLARSEPLQGTHAWRDRSLSFTVAREGCFGQWLQLGPSGPQVLAGDAWYVGLRVNRQPVSATGHPPNAVGGAVPRAAP
jgi:tetratricopeptide (TPR) repeat protein